MEPSKPPVVAILYTLVAVAVVGAVKVVSHEKVCAERWRDVRGDLKAGESRMARMERLAWVSMTALVGLLLSVIGYLIVHMMGGARP